MSLRRADVRERWGVQMCMSVGVHRCGWALGCADVREHWGARLPAADSPGFVNSPFPTCVCAHRPGGILGAGFEVRVFEEGLCFPQSSQGCPGTVVSTEAVSRRLRRVPAPVGRALCAPGGIPSAVWASSRRCVVPPSPFTIV